MLPSELINYFEENDLGVVNRTESFSGDGFGSSARLFLTSGRTFFLKQYHFAPADVCLCEVHGLEALHKAGAISVPMPIVWNEKFLLMEDVEGGEKGEDFEVEFGRQLAKLHLNTNDKFGFYEDNYIGANRQKNDWEADGFSFFKDERLRFQFGMAKEKGYFAAEDIKRFEKLLGNLKKYIPAQDASLLHGDLWHGNVLSNKKGDPVIVDPAVHYGWGEAELAMTMMFGGFGDRFYAAYEEVRPLEDGYQNRFSFYNLYHYLNHLNIFGTGYLGAVRAILKKFS